MYGDKQRHGNHKQLARCTSQRHPHCTFDCIDGGNLRFHGGELSIHGHKCGCHHVFGTAFVCITSQNPLLPSVTFPNQPVS